MTNKRPLSLAMDSPSSSAAATCEHSLRKQRCFEIKPIIMKRSEIYNNCAPVVMFHNNPKKNDDNNKTNNSGTEGDECQNDQPVLSSCLRPPSQHLRRQAHLALSSSGYRTNNVACSVQFRPSVTVRRIPSRHEYGEETKRDLWSNLDEIRVNALRNEAEFVFDGGNWRECSEEDVMFFDHRLGSLVHPAHVDTSVCVYSTGHGWKPISEDDTSNSAETQPHQQRVCGYSR